MICGQSTIRLLFV